MHRAKDRATQRALRTSSAVAGLVLAGCLAVTLLATRVVASDARSEARNRQDAAADQLALEVRERVESYELMIRGAAGLFAGSDVVDRAEWRSFVTQLDISTVTPGLQGIGYVELLQGSDIQEHEEAIRAEGFPDYTVHPEGPKQLAAVVEFIEPFSGRNLRAFGYDTWSEPVRRAALTAARDLGEPVMSHRVTLMQETRVDVQSGVLLYVPVYRMGSPTNTVDQRREAIQGWTYVPLRMTDFMDGVFQDIDLTGYRVRMYEGTTATRQGLLYDPQAPADPTAPLRPLAGSVRSLPARGVTWTLSVESVSASTAADIWRAWLTLAGGLLGTLLIGLLLHSWRTAGSRAEAIALELTRDLRQRDAALEQSEHRWKFAVEGAGDGLWDWDVDSGKVWYSHRWKSMLGLDDDEIGSGLAEWSTRVHPDDLTTTMATVDAYLRGETPSYQCEHRMRRRDGSYLWVLDRGMVVERDEHGRPKRLIGTHRDISEQKLLEAELRRRGADLEESQRIARMGSWRLRPATGAVQWSPALFELFDLDPAESAPSYSELRGLFTPDGFATMDAAVQDCIAHGTPYEIEVEAITASGAHRWMMARGNAVPGESGSDLEIRGVAVDVTDRRESVQRIAALGDLYRSLSQCNAALVRAEDEEVLLRDLCEIVAHQGQVAMAWIGMVDEESRRVVPVTAAGDGVGYVDGLEVSIDSDDPRGRGPTGTAARTGEVVWFDDFLGDGRTAPWHERGAKFGWAASAALPLRRQGRVVGVLTFYSRSRHWLDEETRALLEGMSADISFALDKLALTAAWEEAEQRFRSLVEQSIAGAYIIQDEVLVYANPRFKEILGYPPDADLEGLDVRAFFAPDEVDASLQREEALLAGVVESSTSNVRLRRQDGRTVHVSAQSRRTTYHERPAIIGMMQDIADPRVAQAHIERYVTQLEQVMLQTVGVITDISEMRDPYTAGHERSVAQLAVDIGRRLGLDEERLEGLRIGGLLHDVGKIAVPSDILVKPCRLTELEMAMVREHAAVGFALLHGIDFPWPVARIAHEHHERFDGSGYPAGLCGEEICLEARIVAVADVIDSMASHRPYRPALGVDAALSEIRANRGTLYDPVVVDAATEVMAHLHG